MKVQAFEFRGLPAVLIGPDSEGDCALVRNGDKSMEWFSQDDRIALRDALVSAEED